MKKLPWIIMGLLFLSGICMIAWSLFPMPVKLISGKLTGDKTEKTVEESSEEVSIPLSDASTIEISEDGFTVIEPETTEESGGKEEKLSEAAVFVPQTDPDQVENTGNYTLPEKAEMKDGSIGVLTIESIGVSAPVYETDDEMEAMRKGIAHYKTTSAWSGNIGLCAHNGNASYCWFHDLHKLEKGDTVTYQTALGTRTYKVSEIKEIEETDWSMLGRTEDNRIEKLPPNTSWEVTELQAPAGYHLNEKVFTAELEENQMVTVTIPDKVKPGLIIRKVDAETGEPLAGAVFTVTHADGKLVGEFISDQNGMVVVENLPEGTYIIEEIQPPEGYLLDGENSKKTVNLSFENNQEVVFRDFAKPKLLIRKIDVDTGEPLEGAVIRVSRRGSSEYTEVTTGKDGTALLENLEEDWYQVREVRSPEGYILDDTVHDVELIAGKTATVVLTNSKEPGLTIQKVDAETGDPLPGAVFRVTMPNGAVKDVTTDKNGIAHLVDLDAGEIIVKEIRAPEGYLLDETEHHVRLESGKTAEIILKNSKEPSLTIKKIDSVTKQPMAGVKFSITVKNGKPLGEFLTDENGEIHLSGLECDLEAGTILVIKEVSTLDGYLLDEAEKEVLLEADKATVVQFENQPLNPLLIKKVDQDGRPLAGVKFRVKRADGQYVGEYVTGISGLATVAGQQPGFFIVEEIETLPGYILDSTPKTVELRIDKPAEVEFINHKAGSLLIKKVNSVDGSALAGATFKVTTAEGTLVAEVTSNQNGYATLDNLEPGTYIVSEIKGPDGFILDNTPHTVVVKKNETATVEIANTPMSTLEIRKVDSVTGKPLSGITFEVEKLSGERIGTFVTDAAGRIVIPDLTPQWVVVKETKTRPGYKLDPDPVNVEIKSGKTTVVKFENQPYPVLDLLKVDAETGKPIL